LIMADTHVVVWLALEPSRIASKAKALIEETRQGGAGIAISDITLMEITMLERKARIKLDTSLETFLSEIEARFVVLPITGRVCVRTLLLPATYPSDPADRIIAATALVEGIPLITADRDIQRSKAIRTVW
jgi:PIN domain nuclease of toxin-antitoxin system